MAYYDIRSTVRIGDNKLGYRFAVGLLDDRWVCFADSDDGYFMFPIGEPPFLGFTDKATAIRACVQMAHSPEHGYGGIDDWLIGEEYRTGTS